VEFVLFLLAAGAAIVLVSFVLSRVVVRNHAKRARKALPPASAMDVEETAVGLTAPYKAYGVLRLTPSELLFADGKGSTLTIPRAAVAGCTTSRDVPTGSGMQTLKRPALVVAVKDPTLGEAFAFLVADPAEWVARLKQRGRGRG
jgi:hypothetical protein